MWMDDRLGAPVNHRNGWNVWLRSSVNGGTSWTGPSRRISTFDPNRPQSKPNGFRFPYGDFEGIDLITATASTQAVMIWVKASTTREPRPIPARSSTDASRSTSVVPG